MKFSSNLCFHLSLACLAAVTIGGGPSRAQTNSAAASQSVTIINTGYGLLPGYRITVSPSGQLSGTMQPRYRARPIVRTDQMIAANRKRFFSDLAKAGPLNALPMGRGQAPAGNRRGRRAQNSPPIPVGSLAGPQVFVLYRGQQTPNLRAAGSSTGQAIYQDVKQIMQVLRLPIPDYP